MADERGSEPRPTRQGRHSPPGAVRSPGVGAGAARKTGRGARRTGDAGGRARAGIKPRSSKNKGYRLQRDVVAAIYEAFAGELEEGDVVPAVMGESGDDVKLSPRAARLLPYAFECKNVEKLCLWGAVRQAVQHRTKRHRAAQRTPVVVFARNGRKAWACYPENHHLAAATAGEGVGDKAPATTPYECFVSGVEVVDARTRNISVWNLIEERVPQPRHGDVHPVWKAERKAEPPRVAFRVQHPALGAFEVCRLYDFLAHARVQQARI